MQHMRRSPHPDIRDEDEIDFNSMEVGESITIDAESIRDFLKPITKPEPPQLQAQTIYQQPQQYTGGLSAIPDILINQGITGIGLFVMGMAVWKLFNKLEKSQDETKRDLLTIVREGQSVIVQFTGKLDEFKTSVSTELASNSARLQNLEREVERIRSYDSHH